MRDLDPVLAAVDLRDIPKEDALVVPEAAVRSGRLAVASFPRAGKAGKYREQGERDLQTPLRNQVGAGSGGVVVRSS